MALAKPSPLLRMFVVTDPSPWMDQFIETIGEMVDKCGGNSKEFMVTALLRGVRDPNYLILASIEDQYPTRLTGWLFALFVPDTFKPWVEVWGLWCPQQYEAHIDQGAWDILKGWADKKGATRIVCSLTRAPRVYKRLLEPLGFRQTGIVMERSLEDALALRRRAAENGQARVRREPYPWGIPNQRPPGHSDR